MYLIPRTRKVSGIFKRPIGLEVRYFHGLFAGGNDNLGSHLALYFFEALRRPSLCEAGDVKDEDKLMHLAFGLFSGKQLRAVMCLELRKQKPLSNALDGLYLLCEEHMLRTQWKGGYDGTLSRQASS